MNPSEGAAREDEKFVRPSSGLDTQFGEPPEYSTEQEEIVQVVYQSTQDGNLIGVASSLLTTYGQPEHAHTEVEAEAASGEVLNRASSILPSVEEESSSGGHAFSTFAPRQGPEMELMDDSISGSISHQNELDDFGVPRYEQNLGGIQYYDGPGSFEPLDGASSVPVYSTVNKRDPTSVYLSESGEESSFNQFESSSANQPLDDDESARYQQVLYSAISSDTTTEQQTIVGPDLGSLPYSTGAVSETSTLRVEHVDGELQESELAFDNNNENLNPHAQSESRKFERDLESNGVDGSIGEPDDEDIGSILSRQQPGAAESGSFKNNFKKRLGISFSTNETDLEAHRHKLMKSQDANSAEFNEHLETDGNISSKFKRTHSVSFNVGSSRSGRLSVDIRNLPSYLTVKRSSIVDVARGAMSSLMHSFGSSSSAGFGSNRRDSSPDEEPIFEEPIAPTLSLGQRVAMVKNNGTEFGTVGWIGQLPGVEDDWVVGVIFDNMIGNCDGAYNGVRYFYSRENFAMFVPLASLIKTDNYIGRPETGTMLSRMSVSLKPGQLISIQRSTLRLQHCFLNAPHQRVGHDVRAVSNRLHCQCHNCGPCAHLTKQGRFNAIPPIGTHHAPNKKNSLAHAAVELLAHHHHHYHDEEAHEPEEHQFGDNAAHACNFVRYSCCQQSGAPGHDFSADCGLVRPELLDNLIHAPRAPHRRSRPRRRTKTQVQRLTEKIDILPAIEYQSSTIEAILPAKSDQVGDSSTHDSVAEGSSYSSRSSSRSGSSQGRNSSVNQAHDQQNYDSSFQYGTSTYQEIANQYNTMDSCLSIREQQRFISQRDSSAFIRANGSTGDYYFVNRGGIGSKIRRCFACLFRRRNQNRDAGSHGRKTRRKRKRRKLSTRNRVIEYRRRQSAFVPSTLAKPQEDLASHGILPRPPDASNSDYSSYSRSSSASPRSSSDGGSPHDGYDMQRMNMSTGVTTFEHGYTANQEEQLKSNQVQRRTNVNSYESANLNYDDYTFSESYGSYKKEGFSRDSALTDLGYFDSVGNSSNDTLKQIVDQEINQQEALPEQVPVALSPIQSHDGLSEQVGTIDISSPTLSERDELDVCQRLEDFDLYYNQEAEDH